MTFSLGDFTMYEREDYQQFARDCLRFAAEAKDDQQRQALLRMADAWTFFALGTPSPLESATGRPSLRLRAA
jgi:hypothetical protein